MLSRDVYALPGASAVALATAMLLVPLGGGLGGSGDTGFTDPRSPHPSILIEGDEEFEDPLNGIRRGNGTVGDPYVIRDWMIRQTAQYGIRIVNTTAHLVIEDVSIPGTEGVATRALTADCIAGSGAFVCGTRGVHLQNVSNVSVRDVSVGEAGNGLRVEDSTGVDVEGFSVGDPGVPSVSGDGLHVENVTDLRVSRLSARAIRPAFVSESRGVEIEDSAWIGARGPANGALATTERQAIVVDAHQIEIEATLIRDTRTRVVEGTTNLSLLDSRVVGSADPGFEAVGDSIGHLRVCGTTFLGIGPEAALEVVTEARVDLRWNTFENNTAGARVTADVLRASRNEFLDSEEEGIGLHSPDAILHNNSIVGNGRGAEISTAPDAPDPTNATHNWWGDPSGPSGERSGSGDPLFTVGQVDVDPWLRSRPASGASEENCASPHAPAGSGSGPGPGEVSSLADRGVAPAR